MAHGGTRRHISTGALVRIASLESWGKRQATLPNPVLSPSGLGRVIFCNTLTDIVWVYFPDRIEGSGHEGGLAFKHRDVWGHVYVQSNDLEVLEGEVEPIDVNTANHAIAPMIANWLHYSMSLAEIAERCQTTKQYVYQVMSQDRLLKRLHGRWEDAFTNTTLQADLCPDVEKIYRG